MQIGGRTSTLREEPQTKLVQQRLHSYAFHCPGMSKLQTQQREKNPALALSCDSWPSFPPGRHHRHSQLPCFCGELRRFEEKKNISRCWKLNLKLREVFHLGRGSSTPSASTSFPSSCASVTLFSLLLLRERDEALTTSDLLILCGYGGMIQKVRASVTEERRREKREKREREKRERRREREEEKWRWTRAQWLLSGRW